MQSNTGHHGIEVEDEPEDSDGEIDPIDLEIATLRNRIDWMYENYSGCDWCCGGGDDELEATHARIEELLKMKHES